jgi:glycosyltransferase involved in cell wall biosynthesis
MPPHQIELLAVAGSHRTEPVPVLLMVRELDHGGVERDVAKIAVHLDRARFVPHVAAYYAHGLRYEELQSAGIPILHLPLRKLASREAIRSGFRLARYIRAHGIQIVHSYDASGVFGLVIARMAGVRVVIGSQLSYRDIFDPKTQKLLRWADRYSDAILVNCAAIRRYMVEDEHLPADKVQMCYNGVLTTEFFPADEPKPAELPDADLVIGTVCVLRREKGLPLLQEAFARLNFPHRKLQLVIVGSGDELPRLQENAAKLGIGAASVFVPVQRNVARWMRAMDIFVLPSYSEAFSNSLLEAMACGCCVVGSRVGGTPELIGENTRGLLFESGNSQDLANRLTRLIEDESLRAEFGRRAAQHARENLTIEIAAKRTADIYDRLLNRVRL